MLNPEQVGVCYRVKGTVKQLTLALGGVAAVALMAGCGRSDAAGGGPGGGGRGPAPVEVAEVRRGTMTENRAFTGTFEARARVTISAKVSGRVEEIAVDVADPVTQGQVVVRLDDDEYVQAEAQARAELAVAEANLTEALSRQATTARELVRIRTLRERGVASEAQLDGAEVAAQAAEAGVAVARAQVTRAEAAAEAARILRGYTEITAAWSGDEPERVVAERFVDEGDTVPANGALLSIVSLDPIRGVVFVPERDYARLEPGQAMRISTDAHPGDRFEGRIERIAPVFRPGSRQARVEIGIGNDDLRLRPGMFIRAEAELARVEDALSVPVEALVRRGGEPGLFRVAEDGERVEFVAVETGITDGGRIQIVSPEDLSGRVVTLGQQMLEDGSAIVIPDDENGVPPGPNQANHGGHRGYGGAQRGIMGGESVRMDGRRLRAGEEGVSAA